MGVAFTLPLLPVAITQVLFIIAVVHVRVSRNEHQEALLWSVYLASAEVLFRMTEGLLFNESVKYLILLLLLLGMYYDRQWRPLATEYVLYLLVLLLGIAFVDLPVGASLRKNVLFNLSGPFVLGVTALYTSYRRIPLDTIYDMLFWAFLPMLTLLVYLYLYTPSFAEITFGSDANFDTSGGFGPNQVATALGFGIFVVAVSLILKKSLTGLRVLDLMILMYLVFRGLMTFSRGGMLTGLVALVVFTVFYNRTLKNGWITTLKYAIWAGVLGVGVWLYSSGLTSGMLNNRYTGKNATGEVREDVSSGRIDIFKADVILFIEHPIFGIGVGMGKYLRAEEEGVEVASHNEVSRLLSEHGSLGLMALLMLLGIPLFRFFRTDDFNKAWTLAFLTFWFLTINHSAMRLAFPGFIYGLSLLSYSDQPLPKDTTIPELPWRTYHQWIKNRVRWKRND